MAKHPIRKASISRKSSTSALLKKVRGLNKSSKTFFFAFKKRAKRTYARMGTFAKRKPFTSFFVALGVLLLIIILGNIVSALGVKKEQTQETVKKVDVYAIGESPKIALQAQVNQEGVVEIVAQMPGIVQEVHVFEGQEVYAGQSLVSLSSNYQGGNAPALQAQLAGAQYKNIIDTFGAQKDLIGKQKEVAEKMSNNTEELRKISDNAESDTSSLLGLNESILNTLSDQLTTLEQSGATPAQLLAAQSAKAQAQAGVNQLRSALKNLEYSTNTDNAPTKLATLQKDISLKQLEIQEKALSLSKEAARLQYNMALVSSAMMQPATPFDGTVERIMVTPGESVNPGTVIAVVSSNNPKATLSLLVPQEIAQNISRATPSIIHIGNKKVSLVPAYVSGFATKQQLYSVLYILPTEFVSKVTNNSFISVEVPVGYADTTASVPFIPIDAVFQSQNSSYVFVAQKDKAISRKVKLGAVYGSYVEIESGIKNGDQIILNRNVMSGEKITLSK